jgi:hypothetical protein
LVVYGLNYYGAIEAFGFRPGASGPELQARNVAPNGVERWYPRLDRKESSQELSGYGYRLIEILAKVQEA